MAAAAPEPGKAEQQLPVAAGFGFRTCLSLRAGGPAAELSAPRLVAASVTADTDGEEVAEQGDSNGAMRPLPETLSEGPGRVSLGLRGSPAPNLKIKEKDKLLSSDTKRRGRAGNQTQL